MSKATDQVETQGGQQCWQCEGTGKQVVSEGARWMVDDDGNPVMETCWRCRGSGVDPAQATEQR